MSLTAAQHEERRTGISGSDAPALAGVNPPRWAQPISVYLEKLGLLEPRASTERMSMGSRLEPVVAELFTAETGIPLRRPSRMLRSREWPWMIGHVDRWTVPCEAQPERHVFEAKWSSSTTGWGPSGSAEVPLHYAVQVAHYVAASGAPGAYVGALLGWSDFRWYYLPRDEKLVASLVELERRFWQEHVLAQVPPPPDGSTAYTEWLERQRGEPDFELVATPEQAQVVREYRAARAARELAQREEERLAQLVQVSMGEAVRLVGPGYRISWKPQERRTTAWKELVQRMLLEGERGQPELDSALRAGTRGAKKQLEELVRDRAQPFTSVSTSRPWKAEFDDEEQEATDGA